VLVHWSEGLVIGAPGIVHDTLLEILEFVNLLSLLLGVDVQHR
jgi:hypothetical protein